MIQPDEDKMMLLCVLPNGRIPLPQTAGAAGLDLHASDTKYIEPGQTVRVPLGIKIALPPGTFGLLMGRSGLAAQGIHAHAGVIDSDYRGELHAILHNTSQVMLVITPGDRVAQLVVMPYMSPSIARVEAEELPATLRGEKGFGSTGG